MQWTVAIGVDTDKEVDVAVALDRLGAQLDSREIAATPAGYRRLLSWAQELGVPAFAIEGRGSYGAGLARFLERAGVSVFECERLGLPRGGGRREDPRLLSLERRGVMQPLARAARCHAATG
jgi:transposase